MGEYTRNQRNQLSRAVANNGGGNKQLKEIVDNRCQFTSQLKLKESMSTQKTIQLAQVSNIVCPNIGNHFALGNIIHGMIEANYLPYGHAGPGNTRQIEQGVPNGHIVDLAVRNVANGIVRFGEIKPDTQAVAGRAQINAVVQDPANNLGNGNQLNLIAWAAGLNLPLATIGDPNIHLAGAPHTGAESLRIAQDAQCQGLYLYRGQ